MDRRVLLSVDGEKIALNKFAREVILNTTLGLLKSLKTESLEGEIVLTLEGSKK